MLTRIEYNDLWYSLGKEITTKIEMPCYCGYVKRQVYFQDYLDMLMGKIEPTFTREYRLERTGFNSFMVKIPDLTLNCCDKKNTIQNREGKVCLLLEYDYEFINEDEIRGSPVKYLLIGEAAPSGGNYVYRDAKGAYITSPLRAFENKLEKTRVKRLIEFRKLGYLLFDLFPFAIDFNKHKWLRNLISRDKEIISKFLTILEESFANLISQGIVDSDWDFCFVGPITTSNAAIEWIIKHRNGFFLGKSISSYLDFGDNVAKFKNSAFYVQGKGIDEKSKLKHLPRRAKLAVIMGGSGPHFELIQRALNINRSN
jgi:hypothetical protein